MSIITTLSNDFSKYLTLNYIPEQYRWLVPLGLLVLGLALLFDTKFVWKLSIAGLGAIGGYFGSQTYLIPYILPDLTVRGIPPYLINLIVAAIAAVLLAVIIRFAIAGAFAYGAYLAYTTYYPPSTPKDYVIGAALAAVVFAFIYYLYSKLTQIIGRVVGTLMLFFGLILMHVSENIAVVVAVVVLLFSLFLMIGGKKKIEAWIQSYKAKRGNKVPKVKIPKEAKHRMSKITQGAGSVIKKTLSLPKKLIPHRKPTDIVEETVTETESVIEEPGTAHVRADGTVETVK